MAVQPDNFGIHPSKVLQELYAKKPYQGQDPEKAKVLFLSLDANWDYDIANSQIMPYVIEYLQDGVAFWKQYDIHHPMLLSEYKGSGKTFHKSFQQLGLDSSYADKVSFIELYGKPTYGVSTKYPDFKDMVLYQGVEYQNWLKNIMVNSEGKTIFVANAVYAFLYANQIRIFGEQLLFTPTNSVKANRFKRFSFGENTLIPVYHFSYIPVYLKKELRNPFYQNYRKQIDYALNRR